MNFPLLAIHIVVNIVAQPSGKIDTDRDFDKEQIQKWMAYYAEEADRYAISIDGDREQKLTRSAEPVLRWSNPVIGNGTTHGAVFVWTINGRAEAVGTIFSYVPSRDPDKMERTVAHGFHSLSLKNLVAYRNDEQFWNPTEPGVEPKVIPDAPAPAKTRRLRFVQLKQLAQQFHATSGKDDNERDLRLITRPVYRYDSATDDCLDGGLFCFMTGTDPEMLMVVEVRETKAGPIWHFSAGRFSHLTLRLFHDDTEVWKYVRGEERSRAADPTHR